MIAAPPIPCGQGFTIGTMESGNTLSIYSTAFLPCAAPPPAASGITLRAAIDEVLAAKVAAGLHPHSIEVLRYVLKRFSIGRESAPLASITAREIEIFLAGLNIKPVTKQSFVGRLSSLFSYHVRKDNLLLNPCRKLERIKVVTTAPVVLTPEQADTLLLNTPAKFRPYVVLGMFAGIRPDELHRLTWRDVCLETKTVTVNLAKTRRRRIVPLEPRAVFLLKRHARKKGNIAPNKPAVRRFKRAVRECIGCETWPQDLLRHTAASYLLALLGDVGKVAARLGNSSSVMLTHYHQPVTAADCEEFWRVKQCVVPCRHAWKKHDWQSIRLFYSVHKSYKRTCETFGISSRATLHYILKNPLPS